MAKGGSIVFQGDDAEVYYMMSAGSKVKFMVEAELDEVIKDGIGLTANFIIRDVESAGESETGQDDPMTRAFIDNMNNTQGL